MDNINNIEKSTTILIIAHRLSTISNCDRVIQLENGNVKFDGPPEKILNNLSW